ncbi:MAG: SH3 domain-containing protein [Campylobacter sp.]|nr:SH3 domain-containing protein [Campylobacter sp.]
MKILFLLFFLALNLFSQNEFSVFEEPNKLRNLSEEEQKIYKNIAPSDEQGDFESNIENPFIPQSSLVLSIQDYPSRVYVGEVFCIKVYAKTTEETNFDLELNLTKNDDLEFLTPNPKWKKQENTYETALCFEALSSNANLEQIIVQLTRNKEMFQEAGLWLEPIKFELTPTNKNFSHIVASSLEVKKVKTSFFDDKNVIMMLELSATNANLKSFRMDNVERQGIENYKGDFNSSSAFYYAIFPSFKNNFEFSYFNKESKKLENFNLKLQISDDEISTQSDLNPVNKDFNIYKQYGLWALALLFALIFIFTRSFIVLFLALVCFALSFLVDTSTQNGILKAGSKVKILPTTPSTYFYTANSNEEVEILNQRENYIKILLKNGKIGWVSRENLQKN